MFYSPFIHRKFMKNPASQPYLRDFVNIQFTIAKYNMAHMIYKNRKTNE